MTTEYTCTSDRYDPNGETYTLPEFLAMCVDCFGEAPELTENCDGSMSDSVEIVLVPVEG